MRFIQLGKVFVSLLFIVILISGCDNKSTPPPKPTPTPVAFSAFDLQIPPAALATPVDKPVSATMQMHVTVLFKLNTTQQNQLQKVDPKNPTNLQKLGLTNEQIKEIEGYLMKENVKVTVNKLNTSITADGTALAFSHIFQTTFVYHTYQNRQFFAPVTSPKVPTFMVLRIVSITGLDSYSAPMQTGMSAQTKSYDFSKSSQADCNAPAGSLLPQNVGSAYGFSPFLSHGFTGQNMTIILIEIDGVNPSDISNYASCVGYRGKIDVKTVGTKAPSVQGESTLDMDMIMGLNPDVHIVDYQTADNSSAGLIAVIQQVVNDYTKAAPGTIVSMSLGAAENFSSRAYLDGADQLFQTLNAEHLTTFVSSGDCAAFADHTWGSVSVSFPASDPNVISVGGTELTTDPNGNRVSEIAWSDGSDQSKCTNQWGTGGGSSNYFAQPKYQTGENVNNTASRGFRQIPDVSAAAFTLPVFENGQWQVVGGTSAAAPIWAAGMSLVNQALIKNKHVFYSGPVVPYYVATHGSGFNDITSGDNIAFSASQGWDFATGWGSPNFLGYYNVLANVKG